MELQEVKELRLKGYSAPDIGALLGVGRTAALNYINRIEFTPEELSKITKLERERRASKIQKTTKVAVDTHDREALLSEINRLHKLAAASNAPPLELSLHPVKKGFAAELLVKYYLMRQGIEFLDPGYLAKSLDLVVRKANGQFLNCEIKAASSGEKILIQRTSFINGKMQANPYTVKDGIDVFILVSLETEAVCILPFDQWNGQKSCCIGPRGAYSKWVGAYDLLK